MLTKIIEYANMNIGFADKTVGGCPLESKCYFRRDCFLFYLSLRVFWREVLPMEYLVMLFLILVASVGYIESCKNKDNNKK